MKLDKETNRAINTVIAVVSIIAAVVIMEACASSPISPSKYEDRCRAGILYEYDKDSQEYFMYYTETWEPKRCGE